MSTTSAGSRWPSDHSILDRDAAGLKHPASVCCKLFTLPNTRIGRRIGHLAAADRAQLPADYEAIPHA